MGVTAVGLVPVWTLREVLDNSGLCLSKMHIHVSRLPFCTLHTVVIAVLLPRIPQEQYAQRNISLEGFNGAELLQVLLCLSSMNRQGQVVWEEFVAVRSTCGKFSVVACCCDEAERVESENRATRNSMSQRETDYLCIDIH